MITGFNTDVQHGGCVYHVQTEDRGREHPFFESLVYVGGTIVAKKRTPYREQVDQGATEEAIALLLRRQHQVVIAAIKAGRIEDLIRHTVEEGQVADLGHQASAATTNSPAVNVAAQPIRPPPVAEKVKTTKAAPSQPSSPATPVEATSPPQPQVPRQAGRSRGSKPLAG